MSEDRDIPGLLRAVPAVRDLDELQEFRVFRRKGFSLFLLVELKDAGRRLNSSKNGQVRATFGPEFGPEFGPNVGHTRYVTMRASKEAVIDPDAFCIWNDHVSRVELSLPVKPSKPEAFEKKEEY